MDRDLLVHLPVVVMVALRKGFAPAASELNMSPSAVSHAVKAVEDRVGMPIFNRTTRSVALTEAGEKLIASLAPALTEIQEGIDRIRSARGGVAGLLRISVPHVALSAAITPILVELATAHPDLVVEVTSDDGLIDIVSEGYDAGVRVGGAIPQDMVAVRLTPAFASMLVASPAYLAAKGAPRTLADLQRHNCIGYRLVTRRSVYFWDLADHGEEIAVEVNGTVLVNNPNYARDLAIAGIGIAYLFEPHAQDDIEAGRLVRLLPESSIEHPGFFLYYPRRASGAPKLRAFIDVARQVQMAGRRQSGSSVPASLPHPAPRP